MKRYGCTVLYYLRYLHTPRVFSGLLCVVSTVAKQLGSNNDKVMGPIPGDCTEKTESKETFVTSRMSQIVSSLENPRLLVCRRYVNVLLFCSRCKIGIVNPKQYCGTLCQTESNAMLLFRE